MRAAPRRFPVVEVVFLVALIGAAALVSWASGRTLVVAEFFAPALGAIQAVTNTWSGGVERVQNLKSLEEENTRLKKDIAELEQAIAAREEAARENDRLHDLMKLHVPAQAEPLLVARVVGRNPDNWHQRLLLDKGSEEGVKTDTVAADHHGLIGRVLTVSPHTSLAVLVTDPASAVGVLNARTRSPGVIQGQGDQWPTLRYLDQPEKWKVGDRLITSGLGGAFPKGLAVGKIVKIKSASDMFFPELRVQINAPLERLEEVLLLPPGLREMPVPSPKPTLAPSPAAAGSPTPGKSP